MAGYFLRDEEAAGSNNFSEANPVIPTQTFRNGRFIIWSTA